MPYCPNCRSEYVDGVASCPDCKVALVGELPPPPPRYSTAHVEEVVVGEFVQPEAEMWAEVLRNEGIPSVLVAVGAPFAALGTTFMAPHQLRVAASDAKRAREILEGTPEED